MKNIFVYGWYNHGNAGDEAMKVAIQQALGSVATLTFGDRLDGKKYDAVIFGGGSFLDQKIQGASPALSSTPVGFLGVGVGTSIHNDYQALLSRATFVVVRDTASAVNVKARSLVPAEKIFVCSDLVFSLTEELRAKEEQERTTVAVYLSDHFTPRQDSPVWFYQAHAWFTRELAKALDVMAKEGKEIVFYPFCQNPYEDDARAAAAVIGLMDLRHKVRSIPSFHYQNARSLDDLRRLALAVQRSSLVITQRLHGGVFAAMYQVPCLMINGHDKFDSFTKDFREVVSVPYYGFTDRKLLEARDLVQTRNHEHREHTYTPWHDMWQVVIERFAL